MWYKYHKFQTGGLRTNNSTDTNEKRDYLFGRLLQNEVTKISGQ